MTLGVTSTEHLLADAELAGELGDVAVLAEDEHGRVSTELVEVVASSQASGSVSEGWWRCPVHPFPRNKCQPIWEGNPRRMRGRAVRRPVRQTEESSRVPCLALGDGSITEPLLP